MSVRTVRELLDCLSQGDGTGETLIQRDWLVWTNASGDLEFQHPTCPTMSAMFCCDGRDADITKVTNNKEVVNAAD